MTRSKLFGAAVVIAAIVLTACGSDDGDATDTTTTTVDAAAEQESSAGSTTTTTTAMEEPEGTEVVEQLEPPGEVTGGTVGRSYPADAYPPELSGIIGIAITDLATSLGVDEALVTVVLVEEVAWADASLGCPQPGMSYAQVVTDGMRIILQAEDSLFDYRSGGTAEPFRCVQTVMTEKSTSGLLELQEDGSVIIVVPPSKDGGLPTEGNNPPDE